jgi:y4mF family transcriptional regulator
MSQLAKLVKERRKAVNLTQEEFAERAGVALTVVRKIEQGKTNLNLDKVNLVLRMFGHELAPVNSQELHETS